MKKAIAVLIAVLLLVALAGCGVKQKIADKVTEGITEGIIEKVGGDDVDIDLDDGNITVEGEDGTEWTLGGGEWPKDGAAELIPEFKKGKIASVINSTEGFMVEIEDVVKADFHQYVEALKNAGFDKNTVNYENEDELYYAAGKDEDTIAMVTLNTSTMVIQVTISSEQ